MGPRLRLALRYGAVLLIFGFLVGFVLSQWSRLPQFDWRFQPGWLAGAVVAMASFFVIQAAAWRYILGALGQPLDGRRARAVWAKSLLARYVPTSALLVVTRIVMAERLGVPKRVSLASIVYELGLAGCAAAALGSYLVVTLPPLAGEPARFAVLGIVPLALVLLHPRVFRPLADAGLRALGREPLPLAVPYAAVLRLVAVYVASWIAGGIALFAFVSALYPVALADLPYVVSAQPVAWIVAVLTFLVPSGLGTRDAALAAALAVVLPLTVAAAVAIAMRLFQVAVELAFVAMAVWLGARAR